MNHDTLPLACKYRGKQRLVCCKQTCFNYNDNGKTTQTLFGVTSFLLVSVLKIKMTLIAEK
jgi:hypothetical protein